MHTHADRRTRLRARAQSFLQACLIALLINLLVWPPGLLAQQQQSISWNGGSGNWTDNNWGCNLCSAPYPDNNSGFDLGSTYLATISSGVVSLDGNSSQQGIQVDNVTLGTQGAPAPPPSASLTVGNNLLTLGSPSTVGDVLTIYNGGVLNVQPSGGTSSVRLNLNYGTASNNGQINVYDGGSLTLQTANGGNTSSTFTDSGAINVTGSTSGATVYVYGGQTTLSGTGTLSLSGNATITGNPGLTSGGGPGSLVNDVGHTISGSGAINGQISFTNSGNLTENGGLTISDTAFTNSGSVTVNSNTNGGLVIDTSSQFASFNNQSTGTIGVGSGANLTFRNSSGVTPAFQNDGAITISGGTLTLDGSGSATTFDLTSPNSSGTLTLLGNSTIQSAGVTSGPESLINDTGHTILVGTDAFGTNLTSSSAAISSLTAITNNGNINVGGVYQSTVQRPATSFIETAPQTSTLTIDTTNGGSATNGGFSNTGNVFVADGSTLALQNYNGGTASFNNDGTLTLAQFSNGATLRLSDSGSGTTFDLTSNAGTGTLIMNGNSGITGTSGFENLTNDLNHTINVGVDQNGIPTIASSATISGLAGFTNNGNINVGASSLSSNLTIDTTNSPNNSSPSSSAFSNGFNGFISVADGSSLTLQNTNTSTLLPVNDIPTATFNNDGIITLGQNTGSTLYLNDNGQGVQFDLTSQQRTGFVVMNGASAITGTGNGTASLINDQFHAITVGIDFNGNLTVPSNAAISNLASFTNYGGLIVGDGSTLNVGSGSSPVILSNWDGVSTLSNGYYFVGAGASLNFLGSTPATSIQNLFGASIEVDHGGSFTLGGATNPFQQMTNISDSNLTLGGFGTPGGTPYAITPTTGTLTVSTGPESAFLSSLVIGSAETGGSSNVIINGNVLNQFALVNVKNGSTLTTNGTFTNSGLLTTGGSCGCSKQSSGVTHGIQIIAGANIINVNGDLFNTSAGTVNITGAGDQLNVNGDAQSGAAGNFNNQGGYVAIASGAALTVAGNYIQTLDPNDTSIAPLTTINGQISAVTFDLEAGTLTGGGTLEGDLDQSGGTLNPGDPQTFTITGNYDLTAGALDFDLAGTGTGQYDQVNVGGSVTISPTAELQVTIDPGFTPQAGQTFIDVLSWGSGGVPNLLSFDNQTLGLLFSLVQNSGKSNELDLVVSADSSAAPEPGTLPLLLGAMLMGAAITWRIRRRRENSIE